MPVDYLVYLRPRTRYVYSIRGGSQDEAYGAAMARYQEDNPDEQLLEPHQIFIWPEGFLTPIDIDLTGTLSS